MSTPQWRCHQSGECCRAISAVVMTEPEKVRVEHAAPEGTSLVWSALPEGFWSLQAAPCPLLASDGRCGIYQDRPYNCRRWGCFRPTTSTPFVATVFRKTTDGAIVPLGFGTDRALTRQVVALQERAKPWAVAHGWRA